MSSKRKQPTPQSAIPPSPPPSDKEDYSDDDARKIVTIEDELKRIVAEAQMTAIASDKPSSKSSVKSSQKPASDVEESPKKKKASKASAKIQDTKKEDAKVDAIPEEDEDEKAASDAAQPKTAKRQRQTSERAAEPRKRRKGDTQLKVKRRNKHVKIEVMSKVPSLKRVKGFRSFPSFKASMDDGSVTEFKIDQAVFVLADPATLDDPSDNPDKDQYWIATIREIRANSDIDPITNEWTADPSEVFVIVQWFYRRQDVAGAPVYKSVIKEIEDNCAPYFGWHELIRSHHDAVISVFSCCEPCPIFKFQDNAGPDKPAVKLLDEKHRLNDDEDVDEDTVLNPDIHPNHLHASQNNYFYRLTLPDQASKTKKGRKIAGFDSLSLHCVCQRPYAPGEDVMRFCDECVKWYHEDCLRKEEQWEGKKPDLEYPGKEKPPADLYELASQPIVRGQVWGIGGNINIVAKAREIVKSGDYSDYESALTLNGWDEYKDWMKYIKSQNIENADGEDDLEYLQKTVYRCSECERAI